MTTSLADSPEIIAGGFILRPSTCELCWPHGSETVAPQVMRVMMVLTRRLGRVVSRDVLVTEAWDGRAVSDDAINRVLSRIRRLAETTQRFELHTIRKVGYRLDSPTPQATSFLVDDILDNAADAAPGPPNEDLVTSTAAPLRKQLRIPITRRAWILTIAGLPAAGLTGFFAWHLATRRAPPTIAVILLDADTPEARVVASRLVSRLRDTLSKMRGLRLIETTDKSANLTVAGSVVRHDRQSEIHIRVVDGPSRQRIWGAVFDDRITPDPNAETRAVSGTARYLAVWLGDRLSAASSSREPDSPELIALIETCRHDMREADKMRYRRDWAQFLLLAARIDENVKKAMAMDPNSAKVLVLSYKSEAPPFFLKPGETQADYNLRQNRAAQYLARALATDPDDTETLAIAGADFLSSRQWKDAGRVLARAVALDPNASDANFNYARYLALVNQCEEGLKCARIAASTAPDNGWVQLIVPLLLQCAGRETEAVDAYRDLFTRDRGNLMVLRELYVLQMAHQNSNDMRALADWVRRLWPVEMPIEIKAMVARIEAGASALDGDPQVLNTAIQSDLKDLAEVPVLFGFSRRADVKFLIAVESAFGGLPDVAMPLLRDAVEGSSLYFPWALPYGVRPMPNSLGRLAAYDALWRSSQELTDLMNRRKSIHLKISS